MKPSEFWSGKVSSPPAEDGEKNGIDDWLATIHPREREAAFKELLDSAILLNVEYTSLFSKKGNHCTCGFRDCWDNPNTGNLMVCWRSYGSSGATCAA